MKRRDRGAAETGEVTGTDAPAVEGVRPEAVPELEDELLAMSEAQWAVRETGGVPRLTRSPVDASLIVPVSLTSAGLRNRRVWWVF